MKEDHDLAVRFASLGRPRILVIGDLMLDRYTSGPVQRVSPEAPVLILQAEHEEARPGGAASVARLAAALEADVWVAGVVGDDADGRALERLLRKMGVDAGLVLQDRNRPTTVKERFLGRGGSHTQQMLRVDREAHEPLPADLAVQLETLVVQRLGDCQAVLISDYDKGVCTPELLATVRAAARVRHVPVLVDPARRTDYECYRGVSVIKPNRVQAALATGGSIASTDAALAAGRELCARYGTGAALVTLDRDGMVLVEAHGPEEWFRTAPRELCDVTGAGDMVLAAIGVCRAADWPLRDAARLANVAAGLEVERVGVAPITRAEIAGALRDADGPVREKRVTAERLAELARQYRREGKRIVLTNGCFDLLHAGHLLSLEESARQGDVLVVAINSDASVSRLKGPTRPIVSEQERAALLAALECVDHVIILDDDTPLALLEALRPEVLVKGGTYAATDVVGRDFVEAYGGRVCLTAALPGRSTTGLVAAVRAGTGRPDR